MKDIVILTSYCNYINNACEYQLSDLSNLNNFWEYEYPDVKNISTKMEHNRLNFVVFDNESNDNISFWTYGALKDRQNCSTIDVKEYPDFISSLINDICEKEDGNISSIRIILHQRDFNDRVGDCKLGIDEYPCDGIIEGLDENVKDRCVFYAFNHLGDNFYCVFDKYARGTYDITKLHNKLKATFSEFEEI